MNKKEELDRNYIRVSRELAERSKRLTRWCQFDNFTYHVEHWTHYDYASAWIQTFDNHNNICWSATLKIYDGDRKPHELRVVTNTSSEAKTRGIERFDSLYELLDRAEELRQRCVRRLYAKSRKTELREILGALE